MKKLTVLLMLVLSPTICFAFFTSVRSFSSYHSSYSYHPVEEESSYHSSSYLERPAEEVEEVAYKLSYAYSPTHLITSPSYVLFPGNIWHTALYGTHSSATREVKDREVKAIIWTMFIIGMVLIIFLIAMLRI